jgi:hypothetical protein
MDSAERKMPDSELAVVVAPQTFQAPTLITRAGRSTKKKFFEFFTVPIRNAHTRAAYYRAIQQFLAWSERAGYQHLEDIEPITVVAYIEMLQRKAAPPTVKQHMVRSYFLTARAAARHMVENRSGVILIHTPEPARLGAPLIGGMGPAWAAMEAFNERHRNR